MFSSPTLKSFTKCSSDDSTDSELEIISPPFANTLTPSKIPLPTKNDAVSPLSPITRSWRARTSAHHKVTQLPESPSSEDEGSNELLTINSFFQKRAVVKHTYNDGHTLRPVSPLEKKGHVRVQSAISWAIDKAQDAPNGLMEFFAKCSPAK